MLIIVCITFVCLLFYIHLIASYIRGWGKLKKVGPIVNSYPLKVSVIVALRNEDKNVKNLITSLNHQDYPKYLLEFILVDDHSNDNTWKLLQTGTEGKPNFRLIRLNNGSIGKKRAIREGVHTAEGQLIVTTDADCQHGSKWIGTLVKYYLHFNTKLLLAPIKIDNSGFFSMVQQLEMNSLMGTTGGSAGAGKPVMANAANLAFEKEVYEHAAMQESIPTGDDVFLLEHVKTQFRRQIIFIMDETAIVTTKAANLVDFFHQRIRWASKSRYLKDPDVRNAGWIVVITNGLLLVNLLLALFYPAYLYVYVGGVLLKSIPDILLINKSSKLAQQQETLVFFVPLQLVYPVYASIFALLGLFWPYQWKGRRYSKKNEKPENKRM